MLELPIEIAPEPPLYILLDFPFVTDRIDIMCSLRILSADTTQRPWALLFKHPGGGDSIPQFSDHAECSSHLGYRGQIFPCGLWISLNYKRVSEKAFNVVLSRFSCNKKT